MLTMLVRHRADVVPALAPLVASFKETQAAKTAPKKALRRELDDLSPELAAKLLALIRAEKG